MGSRQTPQVDLFDRLIAREGGYVHDPADPGGETKYGISRKAYPHLDIKNLTPDAARALYVRDYFISPKIAELPHSLHEPVLDWYVNSGKVAIKTLQRLLFVEDDGIIGQETLSALSSADLPTLRYRYLQERLLFYGRLVQRNPSLAKFIVGWISRALSVG